MPILTRWFVKTSLALFIAALVVGIAQVAPRSLDLHPGVAVLGPVYLHLLVVGWLTEMIFGVAYWMFPKYSRETPRGSDGLGVASYVLLNVGLLIRLFAEPAHTLNPAAGVGWLLALSAALQWLAGMAFVINTWPRVKER